MPSEDLFYHIHILDPYIECKLQNVMENGDKA